MFSTVFLFYPNVVDIRYFWSLCNNIWRNLSNLIIITANQESLMDPNNFTIRHQGHLLLLLPLPAYKKFKRIQEKNLELYLHTVFFLSGSFLTAHSRSSRDFSVANSVALEFVFVPGYICLVLFIYLIDPLPDRVPHQRFWYPPSWFRTIV